MTRLKVVIACPGLGHERRGFETFADECFRALHGDERLELELAKGGGPRRPREVRIPNAPRGSRAAKRVGRGLHRDAYWLEQATFTAALAPRLLAVRPDVVYLSEWATGVWLGRWRDLARLRFRVLLSNGGSYMPPFDGFDHVQQLTKPHFDAALAGGEPPERHSLVPYGFSIPDRVATPDEKARLRKQLSLPPDRSIAIAVGSLDVTLKRHDQVVRAAARTRARPFVILLGQRGLETPQLESLTASLLDPTDYLVASAEPEAVHDYLAAADVFVLASPREGMGRAPVEAAAAGLPCIVNDHPVLREVLGGVARYVDTADADAIAAALDAELADPGGPERAEERRRTMHERYDWSSLLDRYVEMLERAAAA